MKKEQIIDYINQYYTDDEELHFGNLQAHKTIIISIRPVIKAVVTWGTK